MFLRYILFNLRSKLAPIPASVRVRRHYNGQQERDGKGFPRLVAQGKQVSIRGVVARVTHQKCVGEDPSDGGGWHLVRLRMALLGRPVRRLHLRTGLSDCLDGFTPDGEIRRLLLRQGPGMREQLHQLELHLPQRARLRLQLIKSLWARELLPSGARTRQATVRGHGRLRLRLGRNQDESTEAQGDLT